MLWEQEVGEQLLKLVRKRVCVVGAGGRQEDVEAGKAKGMWVTILVASLIRSL
jgi:hypothetical protein